MGKKYEFTTEQVEKIITDYTKELKSTKKIAKEFGVDESVIVKRLKDNNITIANGSAYSVNYWIQRGLSKDEAELKIKKFKPVYIDYWLDKGFTKEEAKFKIECHLMNTERAFIEKYGDIVGKLKYQKRKQKEGNASPKKKEYWMKRGLTEAEAIDRISEQQRTFTLEKCVAKHGEERGKFIFNKRQIDWQKSLSSGGNLKIGYSKISQELFYLILEQYEIKNREHVYFATKNKEIRLNKKNGGLWLYDFADIKMKKIIEYNGDDYHGNPSKYKPDDYPHPFRKNLTAKEIQEQDEFKKLAAVDEGYEVLTIWDSDYRKNKELTIKKCLQFLNIKTND